MRSLLMALLCSVRGALWQALVGEVSGCGWMQLVDGTHARELAGSAVTGDANLGFRSAARTLFQALRTSAVCFALVSSHRCVESRWSASMLLQGRFKAASL